MDICFEDAHVLAERLARRELSAVEVMAAHLERIGRVNGAVNAVVSGLESEAALDLARAADASPVVGPLHGLPLAVKDLANAAGFPTSMGAPAMQGLGAVATDDVMVARLRAAGALIIGKTNTPEWGLGSHTYNPVHGVTRNPFDLGRSVGGSSGGAAAALACGMVAIADGSDMMGSLRNPAGWSGTYGLRPSWGVVPSEPKGDSFLHQLATNGPMGRCPADIALQLEVIAGPDSRQPHGVAYAPVPLETSLEGRRIGWLGDWGGALPMEAGVLETCEAGLAVFKDMGCVVEAVAPPFDLAQLWDAWGTLRSWSVATGLEPVYATRPEVLKPEAIWEIERGLALSAMALHRASMIRSQWFEAAARLFEAFDAVVLPTAQMWPFAAELDWPKSIAGQEMDSYHRWMEVVVPASLIGLPALAVPAGFGENGLPMGLQFIGKRGADGALLQLSHGWHHAAPWAKTRPDLSTLTKT